MNEQAGGIVTEQCPKVSVIVPVWNTQELFLRACVKSILAQSFQDFELLLIDDGSELPCARLLDELAQHDPRVQIFHQPHGGPSRARNTGLERARGEYIAFVDSDDQALPEFLEDAARTIELYRADIVWGQAGLCDAAGHSLLDKIYQGAEMTLEITSKLIEEVWLRHGLGKTVPDLSGRVRPELWAKIYRRNAIGSLRFEEQLQNGEDMIFLFQLLQQSQRAAFVPRSWYMHRLDGGSMQNGISPQRRQRYLNYLEQIDQCCKRAAENQYFELAAMRDAKIANSMMDMLTPYACSLPLREATRQIHAILGDKAFAAYCAGLRFKNMKTAKERMKWFCCKYRFSLLIFLILRRKATP